MHAPPAQFHQQLVTAFSLDEIKQHCFDLNIEYEELGAETRSAKARGLIVFCASHNRLQSLFDVVRSQRHKSLGSQPSPPPMCRHGPMPPNAPTIRCTNCVPCPNIFWAAMPS